MVIATKIINVQEIILGSVIACVIVLIVIGPPALILFCLYGKLQDRKDRKRIAALNREKREHLEAKDKITIPPEETYRPYRWGRKCINAINSMVGPQPGTYVKRLNPAPSFGKEK